MAGTEDDLPETAPKSLAGATFLLVQQLSATVEQGFLRLEEELSAKANVTDIDELRRRVIQLEDDRDAQAAVRAFRGKMWRALVAVAAFASSLAIVFGVVR